MRMLKISDIVLIMLSVITIYFIVKTIYCLKKRTVYEALPYARVLFALSLMIQAFIAIAKITEI